MQQNDIYKDIAERTGGEIYLGFVGPVRTGKSTLIKRIMDLLVIPNIKNPSERDRAKDELPQSGTGKTITTAEPKFIPNEAVEIVVREGLKLDVRMVDCVGYRVDGALGYDEEDGPRMVRTPWFEEAIPFQEAAETGTRKVITEHSTIGLAVFTDGSILDIPRENYLDAEERVIYELKEINKPFVIILNSVHPTREDTLELASSLEEQYNAPVLPLNCAKIEEEDVLSILEEALYEFPVTEVNVNLPKWIDELEKGHWLRGSFEQSIEESVEKVYRLRDIDTVIDELATNDNVEKVYLKNVNLGTGSTDIDIKAKDGLLYQVLEEITGYNIESEHNLFRLMIELNKAKKEYDKIEFGLQEVKNTGYGMVAPTVEEMELQDPELIKLGRGYGVRLKAIAPSYHLVKASITTELTPLIGSQKQCEDLISYIMEEFDKDPQKIWDTNIFGKSLSDLVRENIQGKLYHMPENAQQKLQETLERIVNEGNGGLICIII